MESMNSQYSIFQELLTQHPDLRRFLVKICQRCRKRGALTGMMKLGQRLNRKELAALRALFGMQALSVTRSDEVRVSFDRYFKEMNPALVEEWIDGLHLCLDLPRGDAAGEQYHKRREVELVLERLRLAFPELTALHHALAAETGSVGRFFSCNRETQANYFKAAAITRFLLTNREPVTFSDLGARFCNDSKALRNTELSRLVAAWLLVMEQEQGSWPDAEDTVWDRHHVVRDRLSVQATVFGPLLYEKNNHTHDWIYKLWRAGEPATLSWANIAGIDRMFAAAADWPGNELITCENETPFGRMVRERRPGIIIYTCGFPNDAVLSLYRHIAPQAGSRRHWGDSDLAGLRIAAMLHAVHSLRLWRCDLANLQKQRNHMIALPEEQKKRIEQFLANHPGFPFSAELCFTLEHGWLEQESWDEIA